jgi:hypothetical protein
MSKIKITINRIDPSSQEILKKRNFDEVIHKFNFSKSILISPWFYGAIGFSVILGFVFVKYI